MSALEFDVTKMTGCLYGNMPSLTVIEALTYDGFVKAVHKKLVYPLYGQVVEIDYAEEAFSMKLENTIMSGLLVTDYVILPANTIDPTIPKTLGLAIIINNEIFSVVTITPFPVWVGDKNLVYHCEDVQTLTNIYGYTNLF